MLAGLALRNQLILPLQQSIYDYWRSLCSDGHFPNRSDLDPSQLVDHLSMLSLTRVDQRSGKPRFQYRLVGTGFWDLYEAEVQGCFIDELPLGDRCQYWQRVLSSVITERRPSAGVTRPGTPFGAHKTQFWIRMPMSTTRSGEIDLILGYDQLINTSDAGGISQEDQALISA